MRDTFSTAFAILFILVIITLIIALIKPAVFKGKSEHIPERKTLGWKLGLAAIALFVLTGITTPPSSAQDISPSPSPSKTTTPSLVPSPSKTPVPSATPTPTVTPNPLVRPTATQAPATPQVQPSAYYANCTAARSAGVTPIYRGEAGYRSALDRDNDGIACE